MHAASTRTASALHLGLWAAFLYDRKPHLAALSSPSVRSRTYMYASLASAFVYLMPHEAGFAGTPCCFWGFGLRSFVAENPICYAPPHEAGFTRTPNQTGTFLLI